MVVSLIIGGGVTPEYMECIKFNNLHTRDCTRVKLVQELGLVYGINQRI